MWDLVSLGELLVDFTPAGTSEKGNPLFERNPGGGPANLACAAARLGVKTAFIGQVGDDTFGRALRDIVRDNQVDVTRLRLTERYQTSLSFVHLAADGDRSFSFYRRQGADTMLTPETEDFEMVANTRCFFYSSVLMTGGDSRQASFRLAAHARQAGAVTVYDPNLRLNLWASAEEAREVILHAMQWAAVVKVSEEELTFLTGETEWEQGAAKLRETFGMDALLVTLGAEGCLAYIGEHRLELPGFPVRTVDTTAAGDSFTGGFLYGLLGDKTPLMQRPPAQLREMLAFANAVGALTTTKKGAISALPSLDEVRRFLRERGTA